MASFSFGEHHRLRVDRRTKLGRRRSPADNEVFLDGSVTLETEGRPPGRSLQQSANEISRPYRRWTSTPRRFPDEAETRPFDELTFGPSSDGVLAENVDKSFITGRKTPAKEAKHGKNLVPEEERFGGQKATGRSGDVLDELFSFQKVKETFGRVPVPILPRLEWKKPPKTPLEMSPRETLFCKILAVVS
jgi:hypothetical protein